MGTCVGFGSTTERRHSQAAIIAAKILGMVARTALYEYATEDRRVGPFVDRNPASVFPES